MGEISDDVKPDPQPPAWFMGMLGDLYRREAIEKHKAERLSWPWYGRFQHWLFASWRCPACKFMRGGG